MNFFFLYTAVLRLIFFFFTKDVNLTYNLYQWFFFFNSEGQVRPSDVLALIFGMVSGICKQHFPYISFHCGPMCPLVQCPGYQGDYISHPGVQRVFYSRHHVFNVLPGCQTSFYCVNQNFKEQNNEGMGGALNKRSLYIYLFRVLQKTLEPLLEFN